MVDKKTILYSVVLAILISGGMNIPSYLDSNEDMIGLYFCESRSMVMDCDSLSSGLGTRCYFNETYKKCAEGWAEIEPGIELQNETVIELPREPTNIGIKFICTSSECIEMK